MKAAAPPASAIASSWAPPICLSPGAPRQKKFALQRPFAHNAAMPPPSLAPSVEQLTGADRGFDLSRDDPRRPACSSQLIVKHYFAALLIYGTLLLLLTFNPWCRYLLQVSIGQFKAIFAYYLAFAAYVVIAPVALFYFKPKSLWQSKHLLILGSLKKIWRGLFRRGAGPGPLSLALTYPEKNAWMLLFIKLFYGPLMVNSVFYEYNKIPAILPQFRLFPTWLSYLDGGYMILIAGIFLLDSSTFCLGYHTEAAFMRNRIRYVETNVFRLAVCLICYPPFNIVPINVFGPSFYSHGLLFMNDIRHPVTWILRAVAVFFLLVLISTTLSLFTRASNLTNRGIVQHGAYAIVRHPGYLAKNMFWLMTIIPLFFTPTNQPQFSWFNHLVFCVGLVAGFLGWCLLYYLRAITEEDFLMRDPDYVAYCQKVKYRFIPGVV
jgi:protein-S-isoprenylcysteine O-methyltransferase Ste14